MTPQNLANARLISGAGALEPAQHFGIEPQGHQLLGIIGFRTPALNELAAAIMIGALEKIVGQFGISSYSCGWMTWRSIFFKSLPKTRFFRGHLLIEKTCHV